MTRKTPSTRVTDAAAGAERDPFPDQQSRFRAVRAEGQDAKPDVLFIFVPGGTSHPMIKTIKDLGLREPASMSSPPRIWSR